MQDLVEHTSNAPLVCWDEHLKVKQENEVIEVNKNDILKETMRVEIINELRGKCVDMFDNVVKK